ncbi:hypothetical protein QVD17_20556 [Tagetes erecta]|uniref:Secreted protein n=1 Tax=Tagetes erecta TaxID=13708 RepID=A0AAD8NY84_TARER|nr:hypothetical protein QVD17_20556 [Tagetes erecta]
MKDISSGFLFPFNGFVWCACCLSLLGQHSDGWGGRETGESNAHRGERVRTSLRHEQAPIRTGLDEKQALCIVVVLIIRAVEVWQLSTKPSSVNKQDQHTILKSYKH